MAHTKQTPRNPNLERPSAAMGSDVQERRVPFEAHIQENSNKRRETTSQTYATQTTEMDLSYWWN